MKRFILLCLTLLAWGMVAYMVGYHYGREDTFTQLGWKRATLID